MNTVAEARRDGIRIAKMMIRAANRPVCKDCGGKHYAKGLCRRHYEQQRYVPQHHRRGPRPTFDWAACGSSAQFKKHCRQGVPMCEACRRAENRRTQDSRKKLSKVPGKSGTRMIL